MSLPIVDRSPTELEMEKFRLLLSTYQDGSGMVVLKGHNNSKGKFQEIKDKQQKLTLPGWRDFERTVALAFNGHTTENKAIYDVLIDAGNNHHYGVSCKMRNQLHVVDKSGRVSIELSNAAGKFWDILKPHGIRQDNYANFSKQVGRLLIKQIEDWHRLVDTNNGGTVISEKSYFLSLQYEQKPSGDYQLFQFSLQLPDPDMLAWSVEGRHLSGKKDGEVIIEWYGFSGGQLKYYPNQRDAIWISQKFKLECLPDVIESELINKARIYFPKKWSLIEQ